LKTFKLVSLDIFEKNGIDLRSKPIDLIDGLIINREDEKNQWLIEAYTDKQHLEEFEEMKKSKLEKVLQVKITKETNKPATLMGKIVGINKIGSHINVLFMAKLIDRKQEKVEEMLQALIEKGYQGEELLTQFKQKVKVVEGSTS
jgi:hypothetical protein